MTDLDLYHEYLRREKEANATVQGAGAFAEHGQVRADGGVVPGASVSGKERRDPQRAGHSSSSSHPLVRAEFRQHVRAVVDGVEVEHHAAPYATV